MHDQILKDPKNVAVYSDGSGYEGHIGASAVLPADNTRRLAAMGNAEVSTVYAAELQGILMALQLAEPKAHYHMLKTPIHVFTDNQAAIKATAEPGRQSGQYILRRIISKLTRPSLGS